MRLTHKIISTVMATLCSALMMQTQAQEVDYEFLSMSPPKKVIKKPVVKPHLRKHADILLSPHAKVRQSQGANSYNILIEYAKIGDSYASFATGMYNVLDQDKQGLDLTTGLLLMNQAMNYGSTDAQYALALIYIGKSMDISRSINSSETPYGKDLSNVVIKDANQFKNLGYEYILDLASKGHEGAYMLACNMLVSGKYLNQNLMNATLCYHNAVKLFDSPIAKGILAKIYFDAPEFDSIEFEQKGMELAQQASMQGNTYAMAILGKQMIYPKHLSYSDPEKGTKLIMASAYHDEPIAISYRDQMYDEKGRLIQPLLTPPKNSTAQY